MGPALSRSDRPNDLLRRSDGSLSKSRGIRCNLGKSQLARQHLRNARCFPATLPRTVPQGAEGTIASVKDIFELAENSELADAEKRYLPQGAPETRAIILAESRGSKLGDLTKDIPKCMVDVRCQPLLRRLTSALNQAKIRNIAVVRGYQKQTVNLASIKYFDNDNHQQTGELASLNSAAEYLSGPIIFAYGDILFRHHILDQLVEAEGDIVLIVDALWREKDPAPDPGTATL